MTELTNGTNKLNYRIFSNLQSRKTKITRFDLLFLSHEQIFDEVFGGGGNFVELFDFEVPFGGSDVG